MNLSNSKILLIIIASTAILIGNAYAAVTPFTDDVTISPGKLGIGTTSPTAPLHVSAGSLATGSDVVTFDKTRSASNAVRAATFFDVGGLPSDGNGGAYWRGYHLAAPALTVSASSVFPRLVTYSEYNSLTDPASRLWIIDASNAPSAPHDIVYRIEGSNILYLDDSGKIGIGTTSPSAPLHVSAGSLATGSDAIVVDKTRSSSNAVRAATFTDVGGLPSDGNGGAYWRGYHLLAPTISVSSSNVFPRLVTYSEYNSLTDPASRLWIIDASNAQTSPHDIVYRIEGRTILYLDDSGKVGFGTTSPVEKIDIAGNIRLTGNIVSPNDICIGTCP